MRAFPLSVAAFLAIACTGALGLSQRPTGDIACASNAYPPSNNASVPKFVINLDLPPEERWKELITAKKAEILKLRDALVDLVGGVFNGLILKLVDQYVPELAATLPSPYREELQSLSDITGMPLGEVVLYNVFYEFFTVCTSIVAQNEQGQIIHARNLDFGLFLGWNKTTHSWTLTEVLRPNVVQLEWQKGGKTVFHSVNFAGYIGLLTAMNPGVMSFTLNERFNVKGGFIGLLEWIVFKKYDLQWVGFLARDVFEKQMTFQQAQQALTDAKLIAPVYFILGGNKTGEGAILTKSQGVAGSDTYTMADNGKKYGSWYVLETNYDHWEEPPFFDDRRTSGHKCMMQLGKSAITFEGLFNVLSTQPNLNKLSAYTSLMNVNTGAMETYLQKCEGDCSPW